MSLKDLSLGTHLKKLDRAVFVQTSLSLTQRAQSSCLLRVGSKRLMGTCLFISKAGRGIGQPALTAHILPHLLNVRKE